MTTSFFITPLPVSDYMPRFTVAWAHTFYLEALLETVHYRAVNSLLSHRLKIITNTLVYIKFVQLSEAVFKKELHAVTH